MAFVATLTKVQESSGDTVDLFVTLVDAGRGKTFTKIFHYHADTEFTLAKVRAAIIAYRDMLDTYFTRLDAVKAAEGSVVN